MIHCLQTERCLLIFDIHQDVEWARRVLEAEEGGFSHLLLGGDYFDTKSKNAASVPETCRFLQELQELYKDRVTFLLGNHDVPYLEGRHRFIHFQNPKNLSYKVSGYTNSKGRKINKLLSDGFWSACRLFQFVNGYMISHAGVAHKYWVEFAETSHPLAAFDERCRESLERIGMGNDDLLMAGKCRGGDVSIGGVTWLDWDEEFQDDLPWPQIVGHTSSVFGARQNGRSWCIDGRQTCYALLDADSSLEVKT
ncbi:metallophosphoesterase [Cerasicoccus frondis]|uniref:metallophosphoesterase n=1 Tax=Cerasicoccus frondis TaxID=490090 RepID=UPI002852538C|nr:metallophosphoesterase [Cerasicoccus frondis]